ncbi:MAG: RsmE family RNA methyltransferase [Planctomycetota bacterium]|jgi:16S rRNA (uracil1498-N3)-methyltransferase
MGRPLRTFIIERPLQNGILEIRGPEANHIRNVFRLIPGEKLRLINGSGRTGTAEILELRRDWVKVRVFEVFDEEPSVLPALTLAVSVPKERRMDWLLEKCSELGVRRVVPTVFRNSVVRPREGRHVKAEKWGRTAVSASKQSGRPTFLEIAPFHSFREVLEIEADRKILLSPEASTALPEVLDSAASDRILMLVGPEGGTDLGEEKEALGAGFRKAHLTPYILRIETAAVAAAAVILTSART